MFYNDRIHKKEKKGKPRQTSKKCSNYRRMPASSCYRWTELFSSRHFSVISGRKASVSYWYCWQDVLTLLLQIVLKHKRGDVAHLEENLKEKTPFGGWTQVVSSQERLRRLSQPRSCSFPLFFVLLFSLKCYFDQREKCNLTNKDLEVCLFKPQKSTYVLKCVK